VTCGRGPGGVEDASLLHVGAEAEGDLVEVPTEHGPAPDGRAVVDGDLAREHGLRGYVGVHGHLGHPLAQRHELALPAVVPPYPIRASGSRRAGGRWRRGPHSGGRRSRGGSGKEAA
jgi:hypothetical protein